mmetsp:Transcript_2979/g.6840  ORF Transcript_2979/g.6840 Transcript_2979/m.6840 type:complete len:243 (-) Transcript_2979:202-930(-)
MPPRRRGGNQPRGGQEQQANAPAVAEKNQAPLIHPQLLPSEVPLFQTGRNREQFWHAATEATYKQVPTAIVRNMNALAVNVWDACGRKKTNRPSFQLEPKIKERIWHFMGSTVEVGARHDPSLSRAAMIAISEAKQQEMCDQILGNLARCVRRMAENGAPMAFVEVSDVLPDTLFSLDQKKHSTTAEGSDWAYLCKWLKPLQPTLEAAGFKVDPSDPSQMIQFKDKNDATKKIWNVKFRLHR